MAGFALGLAVWQYLILGTMWSFRRRSDNAFPPLLDELRQDVRYALRALWRSPGFAAVAILTLGLGIGANTAIFSVVNAVVLRPLPYRDPASLVVVDTRPLPLAQSWLTAAWRERAKTLSDFAGFNGPTPATLVAGGEPEQVQSAFITWNFLSLLGVSPAAGRDFTEADASPGAAPVALLSHNFWIARFGGDASIVGRTVSGQRRCPHRRGRDAGDVPVSRDWRAVGGVAPARHPAGCHACGRPDDAVERDWPARARRTGTRRRPGVARRSTSRRPRACSTTADRNSRNRTIDQLQLEAGLLQERLAGTRARAAVARDGRRRIRASGRVRERGEPAAGACVDASPGAGCPHGARGAHEEGWCVCC